MSLKISSCHAACTCEKQVTLQNFSGMFRGCPLAAACAPIWYLRGIARHPSHLNTHISSYLYAYVCIRLCWNPDRTIFSSEYIEWHDKPKQDKPKQDKPRQTRPTQTNQSKTTQTKSNQINAKRTNPNQAKRNQNKPNLANAPGHVIILLCDILCYLVLSNAILSYLMLS